MRFFLGEVVLIKMRLISNMLLMVKIFESPQNKYSFLD